MNLLTLSLFPGIDLLGRAFELEGFCIVRGPDPLWGGDVRRFHPGRGSFEGIVGGPPCKVHSRASGGTSTADNLIPEFERIVGEVQPLWWLMENVPDAPLPFVDFYSIASVLVENRDCGGEQKRLRRFTFGESGYFLRRSSKTRFELDWWAEPEAAAYAPTVTANATEYVGAKPWNPRASRSNRTRGYLARAMRLQGLPDGFELPRLTVEGAIEAVANGVPMPMGCAVARAVKRALGRRDL